MCQYAVNSIRAVLFLVAGFACSASSAAMYKWVDEDGMTHYTQQPPPGGIEAEKLEPPPAIDSTEALRTLEEQEKYLEEQREKREKFKRSQQRAAEEKARKKRNCELARARLKSLSDRPRVLAVQADGSRVRMTEEERQREIAKSSEDIKEFCG